MFLWGRDAFLGVGACPQGEAMLEQRSWRWRSGRVGSSTLRPAGPGTCPSAPTALGSSAAQAAACHSQITAAAGALLRFLARFLNMAVCSGFSCWAVCLRPLEITDQHHRKREMSRGDFSPIKCHERREVKRSREAQPLTRHQKIPLVAQVPNAQPCFTTSLPV